MHVIHSSSGVLLSCPTTTRVNAHLCECKCVYDSAWDLSFGRVDFILRMAEPTTGDVENLRPALEVARGAAMEAAAILRAEVARPDGPRPPRGKCPADEEAEAVIRARLLTAFPEWGYLGEETGSQEGDGVHVWVVDPNDGTEPMQDGFRGHAVSIALLRERVPVLGVVLAATAPDDGGDLFEWAEGCGPLRRNGVPVPPPPWPSAWTSREVVAVSQAADRKPIGNAAAVAPARFLPVVGIAYRLALVAAGEAAAAVSVNGPGAVDYAGGHALLRGQGGALVDGSGSPVVYSRSGHSGCGARCFGGPAELLPALVKADWHGVTRGDYGQCAPDPGYEPVRLAPGHHITDAAVLSRAQGCLLGQLAGDALGSLVEFKTARHIAQLYPDGGPDEMVDGGTHQTIAGQPTDDSEMALALARTLVRVGPDMDEVARAYGRWFDSPPFDIGGTTLRALSALGYDNAEGASPAERVSAAASRSSQANGSLMRISPLGIWGWQVAPARLAELARADSGLTHPNDTSRGAVAVFTVTLAAVIREGLDAAATYAFAERWAEANGIPDVIRERLERAHTRPPSPDEPSGWVLVALQHAFHALATAKTLREGVVAVIRAGSDTDTNAAIAGALLGAVYGRDAIPAQWRTAVLTCRPLTGVEGVFRPRQATYWPGDAVTLAERLLLAGRASESSGDRMSSGAT